MLDIEEPGFDGLLQEIQGGLEKVQECVSKLQKYADKDSSCVRFASPARHRKGSKESICGEERPERPQLLRKSVSFLPNEMEAPVAGERKSDTQSGTSSNQLSKGDSQDYVSIAKTLGLGIGLLSRQISQAFVPRETWIEDLGGDEDVFQDILEDLAEKYAQKPDTQSRPVLPPSASECEEQKSSHCGCARCCRLRLMMHPQSRRRLIWDSVSVFMISVDMIMLPMIYGMDISEVLEVLVVEWICTIFWSVDMIITFMTGYTMGPDVIMNPRKVAIHYLTTWFAVDFAIVGSEWASRITEFVAGFNAFRAARAVRVLRVVRVVRLIRLARFVKTLQKFTEMTGSLRLLILFNVMKLTLFLLLAVHVFSCGWHFVGLYTDGGWIAKEGYVGESVIVRYVAAVRWTLSQLNGRTDRQDRTFTEMLYVAFTACFTLIFMSIFVSSLTSRMLQLQQLMDRESGYKRLLQRYNEMHNLSFTTVYLAKRHIRDRMTLESDMDTEKELLRLLPVQTQADLLSEVRCPLLSNHPLFRVLRWEYSSTIRALLVSAIKQEPTRHMETIFTKGGVGHQMYFIEGRWLLYSTDTGLKNWLKICGMDFDIQTRSSPTHRFRNIIRGRRHFMAAQDEVLQRYELSLGTYLCEATLWVEKWLHHGDFVSTGHSKVVIVNSNAFAEAVAKHEDSKRLVGHYARHYVEMLRQHAEAGEALGDIVKSDLHMMLGVEKPDIQQSGTSSSSVNPVSKIGIDLRQAVLRVSASPFLRGNSSSNGSFMTEYQRNRSGSSLAGIDYPMPRSLQAQLDTIQSEGEFKDMPLVEKPDEIVGIVEETKLSL